VPCGIRWMQWFADRLSHLVKEIRREICVIRPHNSVYVVIDLELPEERQIAQGFKYGPVEMGRDVNNSDLVILKPIHSLPVLKQLFPVLKRPLEHKRHDSRRQPPLNQPEVINSVLCSFVSFSEQSPECRSGVLVFFQLVDVE